MSDSQIMELSKILGQIEDELLSIDSAKKQAEAVIGSNKVLSDSLRNLFDSANKMTRILENNVQQIVTEINDKISILNTQVADVKSYSDQSVAKINEQSSLAQSKLEKKLGELVKKSTSDISSSASQSLESIKGSFDEYNALMQDTTNTFEKSALSVIEKQEGQIAEMNKIVESFQEKQRALELKIEELKFLDVELLLKEISEINRSESGKTAFAKKWRAVELSCFGACILIGIVVLIKLILM